MRRAIIISAAAAVLATSGSVAFAAPAAKAAAPAAAAPSAAADPVGADIRCLLIATSMGTANDPQVQRTGEIATFYYLGRLEGRVSDQALEDRMFVELPKLQAVGQAEAQRCAQGISGRSSSFQALGGRLEKRLAALQPPAAAGAAAPAKPATPPKP